jgi:hypothetical protein
MTSVPSHVTPLAPRAARDRRPGARDAAVRRPGAGWLGTPVAGGTPGQPPLPDRPQPAHPRPRPQPRLQEGRLTSTWARSATADGCEIEIGWQSSSLAPLFPGLRRPPDPDPDGVAPRGLLRPARRRDRGRAGQGLPRYRRPRHRPMVPREGGRGGRRGAAAPRPGIETVATAGSKRSRVGGSAANGMSLPFPTSPAPESGVQPVRGPSRPFHFLRLSISSPMESQPLRSMVKAFRDPLA